MGCKNPFKNSNIMIIAYGTTDTRQGGHIDTSITLLGAKQYATRNELKTVSKRFGYNAQIVAKKSINKKYWFNSKI